MDQEDMHQLMAELRKMDLVKCKKLAARLITTRRFWWISSREH